MTGDKLLLIDIEASSFNGFPIEIGFADVDLTAETIDVSSRLIAPPANWVESLPWSYESEKIHGLSLDYIQENGDAVEEVAVWASETIGSRDTWTDGINVDSRWLNMLLEYAPKRPTGRLRAFFGKYALPEIVMDAINEDVRELGLRQHRAGDDTHNLALLALAHHRLGTEFK
jgi:hypothetical protein